MVWKRYCPLCLFYTPNGNRRVASDPKIICQKILIIWFLNLDIDECAVDRFACDNNQICANLPGAFQCICKTGFTLDKVTNACVGKFCEIDWFL